MNFGLNSQCKVVLTAYGAEHYNRINAYLGKAAPADKKDGDVLKTDFCQLMNDFGEILWVGNKNTPFKNSEVEITVNL